MMKTEAPNVAGKVDFIYPGQTIADDRDATLMWQGRLTLFTQAKPLLMTEMLHWCGCYTDVVRQVDFIYPGQTIADDRDATLMWMLHWCGEAGWLYLPRPNHCWWQRCYTDVDATLMWWGRLTLFAQTKPLLMTEMLHWCGCYTDVARQVDFIYPGQTIADDRDATLMWMLHWCGEAGWLYLPRPNHCWLWKSNRCGGAGWLYQLDHTIVGYGEAPDVVGKADCTGSKSLSVIEKLQMWWERRTVLDQNHCQW